MENYDIIGWEYNMDVDWVAYCAEWEKIASAALCSMVRKSLINYGKRKAKDIVFGKLTGVKRKKKVRKENGMKGIKRRKKPAKRLSDIFTY